MPPFKEYTIGQLLDEQELLIRQLELNDTIYFGSHPSNIVPTDYKVEKESKAVRCK